MFYPYLELLRDKKKSSRAQALLREMEKKKAHMANAFVVFLSSPSFFSFHLSPSPLPFSLVTLTHLHPHQHRQTHTCY